MNKTVIIGPFLILIFICIICRLYNERYNAAYKARELENNTTLLVEGKKGFINGDTVWINKRTMRIDPMDSIGIRVVILNVIP